MGIAVWFDYRDSQAETLSELAAAGRYRQPAQPGGFEVIRSDSYVLLPKRIPPLTSIFNYFLSLLPGFRALNLISLEIARPVPQVKRDEDLSVSVIVPCRNEKGNIAEAIRRIPQMGRDTEIIFVDGSSTDGTVEEIERQIKENPQRKISLIHQGNGVGKGDAVTERFRGGQR